jgi:hypothetical protein
VKRSKQVLFIALGALVAVLLAFLITMALSFRRLVIEEGRSAYAADEQGAVLREGQARGSGLRRNGRGQAEVAGPAARSAG